MSTPYTVNFPTSLDDSTSLGSPLNNAVTQIDGDIDDSQATIDVDSTSGFPSNGHIGIGNEVIYYTGKTSTSFTGCIRGSDGTTAAAHVDAPLATPPTGAVGLRAIAAMWTVLRDAIIAIEGKIGIGSFIDAAKIGDGSVSNTEFGYLGSVTSDIQTQLNAKQASDADLTAIAALIPTNDDIIQRKAGAWANRTVAQFKTDLSLTKSDVGLSNVDNVQQQPLDSELTALAALTSAANKAPYFTGSGTAALFDLTAYGRSLVAVADEAALKALVNLEAGVDYQAFHQNLADIAALADPNADRLLFWDDSAGAYKLLTLGTNLSITGTTLDAAGGGGGSGDVIANATRTLNRLTKWTDASGKEVGNSLLLDDGTDVSQASGSFSLSSATGVLGLGGLTSSFAGIWTRSGSTGQLVVGLADRSGPTLAWIAALYVSDTVGSNQKVVLSGDPTSAIALANNSVLGWNSGATAGGAGDVGLQKIAPGVVGFNSGTLGELRWFQWSGEAFLASNATSTSATLANLSGLTISNLVSGRKYSFRCVLYVNDSVAADGIKLDFNGGSATATNFRAQVIGHDTTLTIATQVSALNTAISAATFTGDGMIIIEGSFEPSGNGTLIPRFAQNSHSSGTLTIYRGSSLVVFDTP